jgi:hypothetical protein
VTHLIYLQLLGLAEARAKAKFSGLIDGGVLLTERLVDQVAEEMSFSSMTSSQRWDDLFDGTPINYNKVDRQEGQDDEEEHEGFNKSEFRSVVGFSAEP